MVEPKRRGQNKLPKQTDNKQSVAKRKRGESLTLACPQCKGVVQMRGKGYACFSGTCETCNIELEHVSQGPNVGLIEIYPVKVKKTEKPPEPEPEPEPEPPTDAPAADLPADESDLWFNSDTPDEGPPKSKRKPRGKRHPPK